MAIVSDLSRYIFWMSVACFPVFTAYAVLFSDHRITIQRIFLSCFLLFLFSDVSGDGNVGDFQRYAFSIGRSLGRTVDELFPSEIHQAPELVREFYLRKFFVKVNNETVPIEPITVENAGERVRVILPFLLGKVESLRAVADDERARVIALFSLVQIAHFVSEFSVLVVEMILAVVILGSICYLPVLASLSVASEMTHRAFITAIREFAAFSLFILPFWHFFQGAFKFFLYAFLSGDEQWGYRLVQTPDGYVIEMSANAIYPALVLALMFLFAGMLSFAAPFFAHQFVHGTLLSAVSTAFAGLYSSASGLASSVVIGRELAAMKFDAESKRLTSKVLSEAASEAMQLENKMTDLRREKESAVTEAAARERIESRRIQKQMQASVDYAKANYSISAGAIQSQAALDTRKEIIGAMTKMVGLSKELSDALADIKQRSVEAQEERYRILQSLATTPESARRLYGDLLPFLSTFDPEYFASEPLWRAIDDPILNRFVGKSLDQVILEMDSILSSPENVDRFYQDVKLSPKPPSGVTFYTRELFETRLRQYRKQLALIRDLGLGYRDLAAVGGDIVQAVKNKYADDGRFIDAINAVEQMNSLRKHVIDLAGRTDERLSAARENSVSLVNELWTFGVGSRIFGGRSVPAYDDFPALRQVDAVLENRIGIQLSSAMAEARLRQIEQNLNIELQKIQVEERALNERARQEVVRALKVRDASEEAARERADVQSQILERIEIPARREIAERTFFVRDEVAKRQAELESDAARIDIAADVLSDLGRAFSKEISQASEKFARY